MKRFLTYICIGLISYLILLELTTRLFNLSAITMEEQSIEGNRMLKPNIEGFWNRGGLKELANHYKINEQGFNSTKDYSKINNNKINIAIIGDSYIEGFHTDVEKSIGRILENETDNQVEVHEYGHFGGNIVDFNLVYEKWVKNKYDYTFILMTDKDIVDKKPSFMTNGDKIPKESFLRDFYNSCYFIRYLNINHGLSVKIGKVISRNVSSEKSKKRSFSLNKVNFDAFKVFNSSVIILYEDERLDSLFRSKIALKSLQVKHKIKPINHGFDGHWNYNGRKNCAITIQEYLVDNNVLIN